MGWRLSGARKRGAGMPYRFVPSLSNLPSSMTCERCMPTVKAVAAMVGFVGGEDLSGDNEYDSALVQLRDVTDTLYKSSL